MGRKRVVEPPVKPQYMSDHDWEILTKLREAQRQSARMAKILAWIIAVKLGAGLLFLGAASYTIVYALRWINPPSEVRWGLLIMLVTYLIVKIEFKAERDDKL